MWKSYVQPDAATKCTKVPFASANVPLSPAKISIRLWTQTGLQDPSHLTVKLIRQMMDVSTQEKWGFFELSWIRRLFIVFISVDSTGFLVGPLTEVFHWTSRGIPALRYITCFKVSPNNWKSLLAHSSYWRRLSWKDGVSKWKNRSGCCWTVWRMWINVKDLHLACLWDFRLIYSILCSCVPSQHSRPALAAAALAFGMRSFSYQRTYEGFQRIFKNTQIVIVLRPTRHSRQMAARKALNFHRICAEIWTP